MNKVNLIIFFLVNEKFRDIFDFAVANRATFSLLPHFHRALVTTAEMQAVLMDENSIFRVHHAESAHSQVAVVDVGRVVGLGFAKWRPAAGRRRQFKLQLPMTFFRKLLDTFQNSLAVGFLIRILLDVCGRLAGGKIDLRVEALCGHRRRRTRQKTFLDVREWFLARLLTRAHSRIFPFQRLRPIRHFLPTNTLN